MKRETYGWHVHNGARNGLLDPSVADYVVGSHAIDWLRKGSVGRRTKRVSRSGQGRRGSRKKPTSEIQNLATYVVDRRRAHANELALLRTVYGELLPNAVSLTSVDCWGSGSTWKSVCAEADAARAKSEETFIVRNSGNYAYRQSIYKKKRRSTKRELRASHGLLKLAPIPRQSRGQFANFLILFLELNYLIVPSKGNL